MKRLRGPWLFFAPAFLLAAAAIWLASGERGPKFREPLAETGASDPVRVFTAEFPLGEFQELGGRRVTARLAPLHGEAPVQAHEARVLARRFGLPSGEPWRLELFGLDAPTGRTAQVEDGSGVALVEIGGLLGAPHRSGDESLDPLRALFAASGASLEGGVRSILLWGRAPGDAPVLVLELDALTRRSEPLVEERVACGELPRHLARLEASSAGGEPRALVESASDEEDRER